MKFKLEPVAWMTLIVAALSAFIGVAGLTDRVPEDVVFWCSVAIAVLTAILGVVTRKAVTPIADPRLDADTPLVPAQRSYHEKRGRRDLGTDPNVPQSY